MFSSDEQSLCGLVVYLRSWKQGGQRIEERYKMRGNKASRSDAHVDKIKKVGKSP